MSLDPIAAYTSYSAAWNERDDPEKRKKLLDQAWSQEGVLFDEETPDGLVGGEALSAYIADTHAQMPDLVITETSPPQVLGNRLRVSWVARQGDTQMYTGTDFVEFAEDGRVSRVTMFYDSTPE
ncbi:MAG: nuclear transport factor 2 family protein [Actinomycetota bacterium]|nr:nuclear transport factor 2 family protein [Actinomycetota bacterium]